MGLFEAAAIAAPIVGGIFGSNAADDAADAQVAAAERQADLATRQFKYSKRVNRRAIQQGRRASRVYNHLLGVSSRPQFGAWQDEGYAPSAQDPSTLTLEDFEASPGYGFRMQQGLEAATGGAAARHGVFSGATMEARERMAQGLASQEYGNFYGRKTNEFNNYMNRLAGVAGSGQNAVNGLSAVMGQTTGAQINALGNIGNAQAAGAIGGANALMGGVNNALGAWQFNRLTSSLGA